MKALVDLTFSVTEGNMIHDALSEAGAERALVRRFPHTWLFPVEDESLYNAVWEGDTSMALDTEECRTIADALFARSCSQYDKGYETIGDELSALAWKINRAAYPVRMANLAASCARSEGKKEAGDVPARNPAPAMEEVTVTLELDEGQRRRLDKFAALRRKGEVVPRPENCYTHKATLQYILRVVSFDAILDEATAWEEELLKSRKGAVSEFWEEPETLVSVCDASGVVREVTLDEAEAMREAAQGIYEGAPPEPQMDDNSEVYFTLLEASRV